MFVRATTSLAALLLPIALVLSHRNLPIAISVLALGGLFHLHKTQFIPAAKWAAIFIGYAAITCFWSPHDDAGNWPLYLLTVILVPMGLAVRPAGRAADTPIFWAMAITILLLGFEAATGGALRDWTPPVARDDKDDIATARGITEALALAPAVLLYFWQRRSDHPWAWGMLAALAGALVLASTAFGIFANTLALMMGAVAAIFAWRFPRATPFAILWCAIAILWAMPVLASLLPPQEVLQSLEVGPASWRARLVAWKAVAEAIYDDSFTAFLFGHGVEGTRHLGERLGEIKLPGAYAPNAVVPIHPHNVFLQIWYDLGAVGVLLGTCAVLSLWQALNSAAVQQSVVVCVSALCAGMLVFLGGDASLWTIWRVAAPILGAWGIWRLSMEKDGESGKL